MFQLIEGGVCAPLGFQASGIYCGIRKSRQKNDLAMIVSDAPCSAAAVFTLNKVKGAPLVVTQNHMADGTLRALVCNSGNANTCAPGGMELAEQVCALAAKELGLAPKDVGVSSTGVIGVPMELAPFEKGVPELVTALSHEGSHEAAVAIMTTDTVKKEIALLFSIGGKVCRIGSIAKGSGMINPNMATMLCFVTTDAAVSPAMLQKALSSAVQDTFNQISVDGDTSTNDTVMLLANGQAKNLPITDEGEDYEAFAAALKALCALQAKAIAKDGEGATKLIECVVSGAPDTQTARAVSKSVIGSSLLKAAIFGEDANWGRILCAIGYTPGDFDIDKAEVTLRSAAGELLVCQNAQGVLFCEQKAKKVLSEKEITIAVDLHSGCGRACAWGCDLTYDYVKINGDYRT